MSTSTATTTTASTSPTRRATGSSRPSYNEPIINDVTGEIIPGALDQAKGKGGFMLDGSIGRSIYLKKGSLSINLMVTNILNNRNIVTGGFEQSRSDYSGASIDNPEQSNTKKRAYSFSKNPYKFYALGTNGMLNITYKF